MTIKEMQKVYKKVDKASQIYHSGCNDIKMNESYEIALHVEAAKKIAKGARILQKFADAMHVDLDTLRGAISNEDCFVRWCVLNNIEMHETTDETEEEPEESEE